MLDCKGQSNMGGGKWGGWIDTLQLYNMMGVISKIMVWIAEQRNSNDGDGNG